MTDQELKQSLGKIIQIWNPYMERCELHSLAWVQDMNDYHGIIARITHVIDDNYVPNTFLVKTQKTREYVFCSCWIRCIEEEKKEKTVFTITT